MATNYAPDKAGIPVDQKAARQAYETLRTRYAALGLNIEDYIPYGTFWLQAGALGLDAVVRQENNRVAQLSTPMIGPGAGELPPFGGGTTTTPPKDKTTPTPPSRETPFNPTAPLPGGLQSPPKTDANYQLINDYFAGKITRAELDAALAGTSTTPGGTDFIPGIENPYAGANPWGDWDIGYSAGDLTPEELYYGWLGDPKLGWERKLRNQGITGSTPAAQWARDMYNEALWNWYDSTAVGGMGGGAYTPWLSAPIQWTPDPNLYGQLQSMVGSGNQMAQDWSESNPSTVFDLAAASRTGGVGPLADWLQKQRDRLVNEWGAFHDPAAPGSNPMSVFDFLNAYMGG